MVAAVGSAVVEVEDHAPAAVVVPVSTAVAHYMAVRVAAADLTAVVGVSTPVVAAASKAAGVAVSTAVVAAAGVMPEAGAVVTAKTKTFGVKGGQVESGRLFTSLI